MKKIKDSLISYIISRILSAEIEDYGEMVSFSIDSKDKNMTIELLLKGENETTEMRIGPYSLLDEGSKTYVAFDEIRTSKEWLTILVNKYLLRFLPEKRIEIPTYYCKLAKLVL